MKVLKRGATFLALFVCLAGFGSVTHAAIQQIATYTTASSGSVFSVQTDLVTGLADSTNTDTAVLKASTTQSNTTPAATTPKNAELTDAGAPLSIPASAIAPQPEQAAPALPYTLNNDASGQLSDLGYSLTSLQGQGIQVLGHSGSVPRRCATGTSGGLYAQGMALRATANYYPCPDGGSPLFDAYRPAGYSCTVVYNSQSSKSLAVLAHEVGHCLHFTYGQYKVFDIEYRAIRGLSADTLDRSKTNEIIADDYMICRHGLDTDYGPSSYYSRFGVDRPTTAQCSEINGLINTYLIR